MSDFLDKLFHTTKIKEFVPLFREAEEKYENPEAFLGEVAAYLPARLYERYYDDSVPHSFFGLISASLLSLSTGADEGHWKPLAQQSWFVTKENKRHPLDSEAIPANQEGDLDSRWKHFKEAADTGNFEEALPWAKGFLSNEQDRSFFQNKSLQYALEDGCQGSHKFLYLYQSWQLAQSLKWTNLDSILCPALHFLIVAPKDPSLSEKVKHFPKGSWSSLLSNSGKVTRAQYLEVEKVILFGDDLDDALSAVGQLANAGASLDAVYEVLLIAAAQALSNSRVGDWIWPMRAFHLCYSLHQWSRPDAEDSISAIAMAVAVLQQASQRSRELDHNREVGELASELSPVNPVGMLRTVVSHTDPYASATAVLAALGTDESKKEDLFQALSSLAVKNDGKNCYGHDILFVHEVKDCYQRFQLQEKDTLLVAAGFFLGRTTKSYELFGVYKD
ncbi:MAG: hypothetical protein V3R94_03110 [Acidobacteriota bacterium]